MSPTAGPRAAIPVNPMSRGKNWQRVKQQEREIRQQACYETAMRDSNVQSWSSDRDALTGLASEETVHARFSGWAQAAQAGERCAPVYALMLGLRRFETVNLAYGEQDGRWIERETGTLCPGDVASNLPFRARGLHTINRGGGFEVIDLYYERFSLLKPVRALLRRLCRR